jgi:ADP-heptose:LPS heptosyltransferase
VAQNILILSLTRMGDLIQTTPLIQGLKDKHPNARITLMVSSDFEDVVSLIPGVDDSIIFNLRQFKDSNEWEDESWVKIYRYIESKLNSIRNKDYDLLVNLSHSRFSALMVHYLKVQNIIGFHCSDTGDRMTGHPWMQYFGTEPFNRNFNEFNLVEIFSRSADLDMTGREIQVLGGSTDFFSDEGVAFNSPKSDHDLVIGFQIGSSLENRRWSTASFAELADLLVEKFNARILLFGVASESKSAAEMMQLTNNKGRVTDLTGKTDLKQLTGLLKECDYLVTNDTGTMHLAAALNTKIIGLFFAHAHPFETAPFSSGHLIFQARISCAPCSYGVHCSNIVCIEKVLPEHILRFVENHIEHKTWQLPSDLINASELNVYETVTSAQGLIRLKPVIRHDLELEDIFRLAYSVLWREILVAGASPCINSLQELLEDYKSSDSRTIGELLKNKTKLLETIEAFGKEGARLCEGIVKSAAHALPVKLVRFGEDIQKIDEKIELTGMANPEVKPITDMFTKRKENLMGSDISKLGIESRKCYTLLRNESRRMIEILTAEDVGSSYSTHNSIRVAVPGR